MDSHSKEVPPPLPTLSDPLQRHARNLTLMMPFQAVNKSLDEARSLMLKTSKRVGSSLLLKERHAAFKAVEEQLGNLYVAGIRWQRTAEALATELKKQGEALCQA